MLVLVQMLDVAAQLVEIAHEVMMPGTDKQFCAALEARLTRISPSMQRTNWCTRSRISVAVCAS
ncbi:hypothetical protein X971_4771 [Agrobacterium tumefaciens LBA4213 (Ach5)]|nr:hypothetical protein X971_4771 [Agrobacterium tumefaciens LBA4213 (Ach5)]